MSALILSLFFPFILSFWPGLKFWKHIRALGLTIFIILVLFGSWDIFATSRGHWYFNPQGIFGLKLINLPVEEWLFFVIIPFCCIFTWEALNYLKSRAK
jgi:lycopene cyclase domain-containing protein